MFLTCKYIKEIKIQKTGRVVMKYKGMSSNNQWQYWHITSQRKKQKQKLDWLWYLKSVYGGSGVKIGPRILAKVSSKIKIK